MKIKKDYYYYKEMGICWYCKSEKVEKGVACNSCKEKKREEQRERVRYHKEKGYCYRCGNRLTKHDKGAVCGACKYDDRENAKLRKEILHEKGLCLICKKPKEDKIKTMCNTCREKYNKRMNDRYYKKRGVINE